MRFIKPVDRISKNTWKNLTKREKQYLILIHKGRYTQSEIVDMLFFDSDMWLWKLKKRVSEKLQSDLNRVYKKN